MDPRILYSLQSAILFLVIASPLMYRLVQTIFGGLFTVAVDGCPTTAGVVLHAIVFGLLVYVLMVVQKPQKVVTSPVVMVSAPAPL
jgi:hypothetical protein